MERYYVTVTLYVYVCLLASISPKPHVQPSPDYLRTLPVAVARFSYVGAAMCYVMYFQT